jgi:hypothetical protein
MTEVPISLVAPVRLSKATENGVFLSHKATDPVMLTFQWGDKAHLLHLDGKHAFAHFAVEPGYLARGTLLTEVDFIVDLSSRYDAVKQSDPKGALVLKDGELFLIAERAGDAFGDPHRVPLWGEYGEGTSEEAVGFTGWRIVARDGDERITIWPLNMGEQETAGPGKL